MVWHVQQPAYLRGSWAWLGWLVQGGVWAAQCGVQPGKPWLDVVGRCSFRSGGRHISTACSAGASPWLAVALLQGVALRSGTGGCCAAFCQWEQQQYHLTVSAGDPVVGTVQAGAPQMAEKWKSFPCAGASQDQRPFYRLQVRN